MKRLFLLVFSASAVLSCARSEIQGGRDKEQLSFTVEQLPFESVDPATRAIENSSNTTVFQSGDAIGVYVHTSAAVGATGNHSSNMRYVTSDKGATWQAANSLGGELSGSTNKTTAYYPFQAGLLNPTAVAHSVATDQSDTNTSTETAAGALELSDFMVAPPSNITGVPDAPKSTLTFAHAMCKLVVKVGVPTIIDGSTVSNVKSVTIGGTKVAATVNISTATASVLPTVTPTGNVANITPRLKSGDGTAGKIAEYEAIVVPQTVAAGTLLVDIVCATDGGDKSLQYVVPTGQPLLLAQGKKVTLTLSSSADLAFISDLDLMSGLAATNLPLKIKVPNGAAWTLQSSQTWLTLATTSGGTYSAKITGTGTGADQTVYVKVDANDAAATPRESILTLSTNTGSIIYGALQNYYKFEVKATTVDITKDGTAVALPEAITNQVWNLALVDVTLPSWAKISAKVSNAVPTWSNAVQVTLPYNVIGSLNAATLYVVANETTDKNSRSFKIKYGDSEVTITQEAAVVDRILINGLYWATGNLIAESTTAKGVAAGTGVKIGAPTDGGLYFQFGSLIGYKGGNTASKGSGVGIPDGLMSGISQDNKYWWNDAASFSWANDAMVWPSTFTNGPSGVGATWPSYTRADNVYLFALQTAPYDKAGQKLSAYTNWESGNMVSSTVAVGDPCRYYLGGKWRQPTVEEFGNLFKNVYANSTVGGTWSGAGQNWGYNHDASPINGKRSSSIPSSIYTNNENSPNIGRGIYVNTAVTALPAAAPDASTLFFPASGYRNYSNGSFYFVGRGGYYWSGSVYNAPSGFGLYFGTTNVYPQNSTTRSYGFPVRCVSEP